jgi:hypothetical protein
MFSSWALPQHSWPAAAERFRKDIPADPRLYNACPRPPEPFAQRHQHRQCTYESPRLPHGLEEKEGILRPCRPLSRTSDWEPAFIRAPRKRLRRLRLLRPPPPRTIPQTPRGKYLKSQRNRTTARRRHRKRRKHNPVAQPRAAYTNSKKNDNAWPDVTNLSPDNTTDAISFHPPSPCICPTSSPQPYPHAQPVRSCILIPALRHAPTTGRLCTPSHPNAYSKLHTETSDSPKHNTTE